MTDIKIAEKISEDINIPLIKISAVITLLDNDATIPFIARYRKEATGGLDEIEITNIRDSLIKLRELDKRRLAILKSLEERELLTDELKKSIENAESMAILEDIYLPFKVKKKTRATKARERGLEPLAKIIFEQNDIDLALEANNYINPEKDINSTEDALSGASDIIAEWISENAEIRSCLRELFAEFGIITSNVISGKEEEGNKFADYFDWAEPISQAPSHRILAMRRGEKELFLSLHILPPEEDAQGIIFDITVKSDNECSRLVELAAKDSYKRLLAPSMETEIRCISKDKADDEAIRVFAQNLWELLMAPPLGQKNIIALDPGFRTGCKLVCLDAQGKLLHNTTIYPHNSDEQRDKAADTVRKLTQDYKCQVIAVGNGTAGRETVMFLEEINLPSNISIEMVNESGASIYSASEVAREEFPEQDLTVRGSVSIGRRLMDPLSELVKLDPKSIGVGQYQHDVDKNAIKKGLDDVVVSCVNSVGVELNTASKQLLTYVSGLGPKLAKNIISYREKNGPFSSRDALKKVSGLGPKAFEQSAGFLRIANAENPLDKSAIHPESYPVVYKMADEHNCSINELISNQNIKEKINIRDYITDTIGLPTLQDIMDELEQPGRDPRSKYESFQFDESVHSMNDLKEGMKLPGIVTNVTAFGAFVDIGVHQDGLVHISEIADEYVKNPSDFLKVHQKVNVTVLNLDIDRKRISLSLRNN